MLSVLKHRGAQEMAKRSIPLAGRVFQILQSAKGLIENDPTPTLTRSIKAVEKLRIWLAWIYQNFQPFLHRMDRYHGNPY